MPSCGVRPSFRPGIRHVRVFYQKEFFFSIWQSRRSSFSLPNVMSVFRRRPANGGLECRWDREKIAFLNEYLETAAVRSTMRRSTVKFTAQTATLSKSCLSQTAWTTTTKRREENLFVRSGKSEAQISMCYRLFYLLYISTILPNCVMLKTDVLLSYTLTIYF